MTQVDTPAPLRRINSVTVGDGGYHYQLLECGHERMLGPEDVKTQPGVGEQVGCGVCWSLENMPEYAERVRPT
jgi:hypothetical protein